MNPVSLLPHLVHVGGLKFTAVH